MKLSSFLTILLLFHCLSLTSALYQDEVGHFDWHRENIGEIHTSHHVLVKRSNSVLERVLLVSSKASSLFAALNETDGSIMWRRSLDENSLPDAVASLSSAALTLNRKSQGGTVARWNVLDGSIEWETRNVCCDKEGACEPVIDIQIEKLKKGARIVVLCSSYIVTLGTQQGKKSNSFGSTEGIEYTHLHLWSSLSQKEAHFHAIGKSSKGIVLYDVMKDQASVVSSLRSSDCVPLTEKLLCLVGKKKLVAVSLSDASRSDLQFQELEDSLPKCDEILLEPIGVGAAKLSVTIGTGSSSKLTTKHEEMRVHYLFSESQHDILLLEQFFGDKISCSGAQNSYQTLGYPPMLACLTPKTYLTTSIRSKANNQFSVELDTATTPRELQEAFVQHLSMEFPFMEANSSRVLLQLTDHRLRYGTGFQRVIWERDEYLASVKDIAILDQPHEAVHVPSQGLYEVWDSLITLLNSLHTSSFFKNQDSLLENELFGFKQIAVGISTDARTIFALETSSGKVLWRKHVSWHPKSIYELSEVEVIVHGQDESSGSSVLLQVNPRNGGQRSLVLEKPVLHLSCHESAVNGSSDTALVVMVFDDLTVRWWDRKGDYLRKPNQNALQRDSYLFSIDQSSKMHGMIGYQLSKAMTVSSLWQVVFGEKEKIIGTAFSKSEAIRSPIRKFIDGKVRYKFLSGNMIAIATVEASANLPPHKSDSRLHLYVYSGVNGQLLAHTLHVGGHGPVSIVMSEHLVTYSFWSAKQHRPQLSIIELYHSNQSRRAYPSATAIVSSPDYIQRTIPLPFSTTSLAITTTLHGITSKSVIVPTHEGRIASLPLFLLNPRHHSSSSLQVFRNATTPHVPVSPNIFISGDRMVVGVTGVETKSGYLESGSLLLAYGVDTFFSVVAPSQRFDILAENFPYSLLALSIVGLIFGTLITRKFALRKQLSNKWR